MVGIWEKLESSEGMEVTGRHDEQAPKRFLCNQDLEDGAVAGGLSPP
jgi:hypothetical protein